MKWSALSGAVETYMKELIDMRVEDPVLPMEDGIPTAFKGAR